MSDGRKRWHATIEYRTDDGPLDVDHVFEELMELHHLVENGPHFGAIIKITITYQLGDEALTLEEAAEQ